jgi:hypothetical protein
MLAALLYCSAASAGEAAAQSHVSHQPLQQTAAASVSTIAGRVVDEDGAGIAGASVFAMGAAITAARTDQRGSFELSLSPGAYILRASRDGYISTYREAVVVRPDVPMTRNITLLRSGESDVVLASAQRTAVDDDQPATGEVTEQPSPRETVWRLRHLPRTVLRDAAASALVAEDPVPDARHVVARAFADLYGHVDFLTTSALSSSGELPSQTWPRGVAYVVVGAPVGTHGNWTVRAALAGDNSAWTFVGEYAANDDQTHALRAGMSYSAQTLAASESRSLAALDTVRRVGGMYVSDRWSVTRDLAIDSRLHLARYDYLSDPVLASGRVGVRQTIWPAVTLFGSASSQRLAPGADQFAPPAVSGIWLPPERTFSALRGDLTPQHVQLYDIGAEAAIDGMVLQVRRFAERTSQQIATLFGIDRASEVAHYYVSSPGDVAIEGWSIGLSGQVTPTLHAGVDYTATAADWRGAAARTTLHHVAASALRDGTEQLHDVTARVAAELPATATRVTAVLRVNTGFSRRQVREPGLAARFAVELRQQLPVRPLGNRELNLLFSARTLVHEADAAGGFYDELLTVAPPVRLMCGVQMRF